MKTQKEIESARAEWGNRMGAELINEVYRLYYREGFSAFEIAEILNVTEPKVRKWVMDNND